MDLCRPCFTGVPATADQPVLDGAGGYFLAFELGAGVVVGLADGGVAGDLGGFDGAGSGFLPPGDVDAAEGVGSESFEVAAGGDGSVVDGFADARIPHRAVRIAGLREDPGVRRGGAAACALEVHEAAQREGAVAGFGLGGVDVAAPVALLDRDRGFGDLGSAERAPAVRMQGADAVGRYGQFAAGEFGGGGFREGCDQNTVVAELLDSTPDLTGEIGGFASARSRGAEDTVLSHFAAGLLRMFLNLIRLCRCWSTTAGVTEQAHHRCA